MGDGFTDFALAEIENYGSGCADNTGYDGWSQYLELGPAILLPGNSYDCIMQTGYDDQYVTVWIDFNDDFVLTDDEKVLIDFIMVEAGQFYTATIPIPVDATPGLHIMRARTNWTQPASSPCDNYSYGEAEDYMVMVGNAAFGSIAGTVSLLSNGTPVENAEIEMTGTYTSYSVQTGSNGIYIIDPVLEGWYQISCTKPGFVPVTDSVFVPESQQVIMNFELTQPELYINPGQLVFELVQGESGYDTLLLSNTGNGPLNWAVTIEVQGEAKNIQELYDLQFQYPVSTSGASSGVGFDGNYFYITEWTGPVIYKYDTGGNLLGTFTIPGVTGIRNLAWDGNHFMGSTGINQVFELDFETQSLIGTLTAPGNVKALACDENTGLLYGQSWDGPIMVFDTLGNLINSFPTGPAGGNYTGLAYDGTSPGGPYLWGYTSGQQSDHLLVQIQLPSGNETGFQIDLDTLFTEPVIYGPGGLFMAPDIVFGTWTLGGLVQNEYLWGIDMGVAQTWLDVSPVAGTLPPDNAQELTIGVNTQDLDPGDYSAVLKFSTSPDIGTQEIPLFLTVFENNAVPCNLQVSYLCTDITLDWEMCPSGPPQPDAWIIYRNTLPVDTVFENSYTDSLMVPLEDYTYLVTALYGGDESLPSEPLNFNLPLPENLAPENLHLELTGGDPLLVFDPPSGCLTPSVYLLYRDGILIGPVTSPVPVSWGFYSYVVSAVYYFGEIASQPLVITGSTLPDGAGFDFFPNPVTDRLIIRTTQPAVVSVIHPTGGEVIEPVPVNGKRSLRLTGPGRGIYLLKVSMAGKTFVSKLVVR
ncbi:MAG: hypothetical protein Kow00127_04650 [Bacteroidales bacterium]